MQKKKKKKHNKAFRKPCLAIARKSPKSSHFKMYRIHRSRRPEVFCEKGVLKYFAIFTGKHPWRNLFLTKLQAYRPVNIAK